MRPNRDGKPVVPGNGGYEIEMVEVTGPPDRMMPMPPAKSRGRLIPMGTGEDLPERPSPVSLPRTRSKVPLVPTPEEIMAIPRLAKVALAARCARRVVAAFGFFWKRAPEHHLRAVKRAVSVAENVAADATARAGGFAGTITAGNDARATAATAATAAGAATAATAAAVAAETEAIGARAAGAAAGAVADAAANAARVIFETATLDSPLTAQLRCIRRDFVRLKKLARKHRWTDDTPVPPDVFGPMWPEGVAPYWAVEPPPAPPT